MTKKILLPLLIITYIFGCGSGKNEFMKAEEHFKKGNKNVAFE